MPQSTTTLTPNHSKALPAIYLASTSPFRRELLQKLGLPFNTLKPEVDETPLPNETVLEMVNRLSLAKAQAVAAQHPNSLIIASDQSAVFQEQPIGKPHTYENAFNQLKQFSDQVITFYTGLVLIDTRTHTIQQDYDVTKVYFRALNDQEIHHYLTLETPFNCAGSFKSEGLGITLFKKIENTDPNALIGLPLIQLTTMIKNCGIPLPFIAEKD